MTAYTGDPCSNTLSALPSKVPPFGAVGGLAAGSATDPRAFRRVLGPLWATICGIAVGAVLRAGAIGVIAGWKSARISLYAPQRYI
ncbi:hypothetical protein [Chelatococcus asaccharovorans]|uniref:hypothetical protein n=1 Tax=Chelatococcus asaccharovorans TaxID=28210 RepID=UPI000D7568EF|nr:hypothetical protein [Chelatococcus asaccharovorans]MBS7705109.1 hypothetical protein [Chelatococcus asaccharovorans]